MLREQILNRLAKHQRYDLARLHDLFMAEYGWIPFNEFMDLPANTVFNLLFAMQERHKMAKKTPAGQGPRGLR